MIGALVRISYARPTPKDATAARRPHRLDTALTLLTGLGMFAAPVVYLASDWLDFADYWRPDWLGWGGVPLFAAADWLLWRSHAELGRNWSPTVAVREGHALITRGVYRRIRHPMYLAHWVWAVAQVLLLANWVAGPAMLVLFAMHYFIRVPSEERLMREIFGEAYREHEARTGRCWPKW